MKYTFPFWAKPELTILNEQPPAVRSQLISEARTKAMKDWRGWICLAILLLPCVIFLFLPFFVAAQSAIWVGGIAGIMPFGSVFASWWWIECKLVPKHLRRLMAEHGIEICIKCGYDLRGSKERCPECGTEFSD